MQNNPYIATEEVVNKQVVKYLEFKHLPFVHCPNEGKRDPRYGARLRASGMSAGFPDLFIFRPSGKYHGLALELKREKGGRLSPAQAIWLETLNAEGYKAVCAHGYEEAVAAIEKYIKDGKD